MAAINIQQNGIVELSASDNRAYSLRLELALNNMNQGLVMFDSSARIATCNDPYIEMYGLSRRFSDAWELEDGETMAMVMRIFHAAPPTVHSIRRPLNHVLSRTPDPTPSNAKVNAYKM